MEGHQKRFLYFAEFYEKICGTPYPLNYNEQGILKVFPEQQILFLELNSSFEIDHVEEKHEKSCINISSLSQALDQAKDYETDWLKIVVFHHPITGPESMKNIDFLQQLVTSGFQCCMHGHIHEAQKNSFHYFSQELNIIGAGSFGAHTRGQVLGIPWQYNLLKINPSNRQIIVETRRKEKLHGSWSADARWGNLNEPKPRYTLKLKKHWGGKKKLF